MTVIVERSNSIWTVASVRVGEKLYFVEFWNMASEWAGDVFVWEGE